MGLLDFDYLNTSGQLNGQGGGGFTSPTFDDSLNSLTTQTTSPIAADMLNFNLGDQYSMPMLDKLQGSLGSFGNWAANNQAMLNFGVGALQGLSNLYSANKSSNLLRDQLNLQRQTMDRNYNMQRTQFNEGLENRQLQRLAANPNAESVDSVMRKWSL